MARSFGGLVGWQWLLVILLALVNSLTATTAAMFLGSVLGSMFLFYLVVRGLAAISRGFRAGKSKDSA